MPGGSDETTQPDPDAARRIDEMLATTADDVDPLVGATLGAYRIDGVLGRGGMGVVYRGWDVRLDRAVAVKTIRFEDKTARARFQREARSQARLRHRNVVPVHVVGEHAGLTYLVMDHVDGETLRGLLEREGKLSEDRALEVADAIASALEAALARGMIHRDVKPSNVLVEKDGHVLITDFGLAKEIATPAPEESTDTEPISRAPRSLTATGSILGTPAYMAPELSRGERADHRSDMYALGVTLHELLTGRRPERDAPLDVPGIRAETKALLAKLLAPSADDRFDTYAEVRAAIARARGPRILEAPLPSRAVAFVVDYFFFGVLGALIAGFGIMIANRALGEGAFKHAISVTGFTSACILAGECDARWGATPGKKLLRLRTTDASTGRAPSRARAIARSLVRLFPLPLLSILSIGPLMAVPKTPAFFGLVALLGLPALAKGRAALHDRVTNTRIVMAVEEKAP